MRTLELSVLVMAVAVIVPESWAQVPVFEINRAESSIKFNVKASVEIAGTFENWSASVKSRSPELTSAILDIRIQAASVYRKRRKGRKAERERFLRCGAESVDSLSFDESGRARRRWSSKAISQFAE
jgi:hypothetical protein